MKSFAFILFLTIAAMGCKKPYNPPALKGNGGYLVVEGVVNAGPDSTTIKLSRTVNVSSAVTANPVSQAVVAVESDQNISYPLTETTGGNYVSPGLNLDVSRTYRLKVKTSNNEQYASDFEPVSVTPPIDSIGFNVITVPDTGIQIYVNTHDQTNTVHYFRWDYSEAWEFYTKYTTPYISNGFNAIVLRQPNQFDTYCFTNDVSSDIVLGSSAKLQKDVIYQSPVTFIPSTSEKIEDEYSILLKEYALTADAYNFWISLKQNTEQLGSIFDAQPSQITGNIHCTTNPSEPVIGYISVSTVSSKRVFIYSSQLPSWVPAYPYYCEIDSTGRQGPAFLYPLPNAFLPMSANGVTYTSDVCADCTVRGTKTPPPFWK